MNKNLKRHIIIKTIDNDEKLMIGNSIHNQLVGNEDYINNNIVLNIDDGNEINLYIFKECLNIPNIIIKED